MYSLIDIHRVLLFLGEHTLDGEYRAMELHLVHQAEDGSLAVVGIFFNEGKESEFLSQVRIERTLWDLCSLILCTYYSSGIVC